MQEERMYRILCGGRYVKFNLDGTVRGSRAAGATVTESYLNKLPFDLNKAIESGIIHIEEVVSDEEDAKVGIIKRIIGGKLAKGESSEDLDPINYDYICVPTDPINSMNDLRKGEWNMVKVREGLAMGMLKYAKQSEVDKAIEKGRVE